MNNTPSLPKQPFLEQVSVRELRGIGPQQAKKLSKMGFRTLQDLLFHLPIRYVDKTKISPIGGLQPFTSAVIEGVIKASDVVFGRRRSLVCRLQDDSGIISLRFFHFNRAQQEQLASGVAIRCFGEIRRGTTGAELYHPEYRVIDSQNPPPVEATLTPIYSISEGITQVRMRALCHQALERLRTGGLRELLPRASQQTYSLSEALQLLHQPPVDAPLTLLAAGEHPAQQRLALEELLAHHLSLLRLRRQIQQHPATQLAFYPDQEKRLLAQLPFALTAAQYRVGTEIYTDINQTVPMLRLIQGDVGSGKTLVAALAAIQTIANGYQAALMAPTEILSEQHRINFEGWFRPLGIRVAWLTGKIKGKARNVQLEAIASGEAKMVIGTHALFQDGVEFNSLALTIVDEQHRFGVHQRLAFRRKGHIASDGQNAMSDLPHQLIMTATPIPRTLAMSAYADLDCSIIDELPPGREPVETLVLSNVRRNDIVNRVRQACIAGRQAYWVCTLIEESDVLEAQAAEVTASELQLLIPELSIGLVHGRLKAREKIDVMAQFKAGNIHLLVATTVIEVGVDVPNASLMIIENAERLGLSQLHQLRGRVGRGDQQSHCVLLYSPPLSSVGSERLKIMRETNDGFKIAEKDLQLRGPGEVLGTRQTGDMVLRIADLQRDGHLLPEIKETAHHIMEQHPETVTALIERWLGDSDQYAQA